MTTPMEDRLRQTFAARAATVPEHADPHAAILRRIRRTRRRHRTLLGGALALTAVLGLTAPAILRDAALWPDTVLVQGRNAPDWPIRGSLAADTALLDAVRTRLDDPDTRILYAGDRAGHRVVVAISPRKRSMSGALVLYGEAGAPVGELDEQEPFVAGGSGAKDSEVIAWFSAEGDSPLLVLGSPRMTSVRISPSVAYRPDGTPARVTRTLRTDEGLLLTTVPDAKPGQAEIKIPLWESSERPLRLPWRISTSHDEDASFRADVARAAGAATGHVKTEQAAGLLYSLGSLVTPHPRLTYRYLWGGSLGPGRDALIATVSGPGTPTFLAVQTTRTAPDGSSEQERLGRVVETPDLSRPIGWTTALTGPRDSAAVYVPGGAGSRVELRDGARTIAAGTADATGFALFSPGLPQERLRACEYRVLNAEGEVTHRGRLDLGDLSRAVLGGPDW
ncbi:hypothetical protein [Streptosporangium carneum]|uniref:Uncharacterized protein n=1 Tax=Streptosporangium carneum TaxID=47481 RepID=A0A9W6HX56_9ACTN|nr:hypothetical protein [Streptosporangium carneum]GLK08010.1 hypothetical protein GCM10017600_14150 [Streptosporangium carneum]